MVTQVAEPAGHGTRSAADLALRLRAGGWAAAPTILPASRTKDSANAVGAPSAAFALSGPP